MLSLSRIRQRLLRHPTDDLPARVVGALKARGWFIALAESCTGGQLAADLTTVPGSSTVVTGSAVCYQLRAKHALLNLVDITEANVVSDFTARRMASAARELFNAHVGVGTTGYLDCERRAFWAVAIPIGGDKTTVLSGGKIFDSSSSRDDNRRALCHDVLTMIETVVRNS